MGNQIKALQTSKFKDHFPAISQPQYLSGYIEVWKDQNSFPVFFIHPAKGRGFSLNTAQILIWHLYSLGPGLSLVEVSCHVKYSVQTLWCAVDCAVHFSTIVWALCY